MFNFKEQVSGFGLGWSDFGRRWYLGGGIPVFLGVDPISEQFPHLSVFNYASLNPVTNIDLHGLQGMAANAARNPKVREYVNENPETAAAIAVGFIAAPIAASFAAEAGTAATVGFIANEIKDEILSQATGGASDVLDVSKMGAKLLKKGLNKLDDAGLASIKGGMKFDNISGDEASSFISTEFDA